MNVLEIPFQIGYRISYLFSKVASQVYAEKCTKVLDDILDNLGYVNIIDGPIRSGKSTTCSILVNYLVQEIDAKASNMIEFIKRVCFKVNFNIVDSLIDRYLNEDLSLSKISEKVRQNEKFKDGFSGYYDDGLKKYPRSIYIYDYVEAYVAFKNKNYVKCNVPFTDQVFGQTAEPFDVFDFNILELIPKNIQQFNELLKDKRKFNLSRYTVYFIDDISIYGKTNSLNFQKFKGSATGFSTAWRLFGQLMKESGYIIFNSQSLTRVVMECRELVQVFLHIEEKRSEVTYSASRYFLEKILNIKKWWAEKTGTVKELKFYDYLVLVQQSFLNSCSYLKVNLSFRDKEGALSDRRELELVAPVRFGYGCLDTHFFSYIYELIGKISSDDYKDCQTDEELAAKVEDFYKNLDRYQEATFKSILKTEEDDQSKNKSKKKESAIGAAADSSDFF